MIYFPFAFSHFSSCAQMCAAARAAELVVETFFGIGDALAVFGRGFISLVFGCPARSRLFQAARIPHPAAIPGEPLHPHEQLR